MTAMQTEVEVSVESQPQRSSPGPVVAGISNSCVELRESPPHRAETFAPGTPCSQRSSQLSTEPSVSMSSITFARVSMPVAPPSEHGSETDRVVVADVELGGSMDRRLLLRSSRSRKRDRRSGSNRSQVAPESGDFDRAARLSQLEPEEKTIVAQSLERSHVHARDSSPPPPVPPRKQSASSHTALSQFTPSVTPITERSPEPSGMKHSQTFVVSLSRPPHLSPPQLSNSLQALSKPTIAPRVSSTDPNVIHV